MAEIYRNNPPDEKDILNIISLQSKPLEQELLKAYMVYCLQTCPESLGKAVSLAESEKNLKYDLLGFDIDIKAAYDKCNGSFRTYIFRELFDPSIRESI